MVKKTNKKNTYQRKTLKGGDEDKTKAVREKLNGTCQDQLDKTKYKDPLLGEYPYKKDYGRFVINGRTRRKNVLRQLKNEQDPKKEDQRQCKTEDLGEIDKALEEDTSFSATMSRNKEDAKKALKEAYVNSGDKTRVKMNLTPGCQNELEQITYKDEQGKEYKYENDYGVDVLDGRSRRKNVLNQLKDKNVCTDTDDTQKIEEAINAETSNITGIMSNATKLTRNVANKVSNTAVSLSRGNAVLSILGSFPSAQSEYSYINGQRYTFTKEMFRNLKHNLVLLGSMSPDTLKQIMVDKNDRAGLYDYAKLKNMIEMNNKIKFDPTQKKPGFDDLIAQAMAMNLQSNNDTYLQKLADLLSKEKSKSKPLKDVLVEFKEIIKEYKVQISVINVDSEDFLKKIDVLRIDIEIEKIISELKVIKDSNIDNEQMKPLGELISLKKLYEQDKNLKQGGEPNEENQNEGGEPDGGKYRTKRNMGRTRKTKKN